MRPGMQRLGREWPVPRGSGKGGGGAGVRSSKVCFLPQGRHFALCPPPKVTWCPILEPVRRLLSLPGQELNQIAPTVQPMVAGLLLDPREWGGGIWEQDLGLAP